MRFGSCGFLVLVCAVTSGASTVTVFQTGTLGSSASPVNVTDTYGYFGPAGGSLAGDVFSFSTSYDSDYFTAGSCGPGCISETATSPLATTLSLTINGVTYTPDESAGSTLLFQTGAVNTPRYFEVVAGSFAIGLLSSSDPLFMMRLTGLDTIDFALPGFRTGMSETLTLNVETSVSTVTTPEPATLPLVLTGLAGVFALWKRGAGMMHR